MKRFAHRIFLLLALLCCGGCVSLPGIFDDERGLGVQHDDAVIKTGIITTLLEKDAGAANKINVYCYRGHVFLVGESEESMRRFALDTANKTQGVTHATVHWFPDGTRRGAEDAKLEAEVSAKLLFAKDVTSTRTSVDVWGGNVVLTGIMADQADIDRTVSAVKQVKDVKSVTSYLITEAASLEK